MNIIEHILENPLDKNIDISSLIHGSLTKKIPELELAVVGVITETQAEKIKIIKKCASASESHTDKYNAYSRKKTGFLIKSQT